MKILCVIDMLRSGGAQRQLVGLALAFKKDNHDVSFVTYHKSGFYDDILMDSDIASCCIEERNYLIRMFKMRAFIRRGNFDVVISFLEAASFICEIATLPFKRWTLIVGERSANPKILTSRKLRFYRYFHFLADYIVANSSTNIEMVRKINPFLSKSKCMVIYNLLDFEKWGALSNNYKAKVNDKFTLCVAASHMDVKNLLGLVEAVNLLPRSFKDRLVINWYGEGAEPPYLDNSFIESKKKINEYNLRKIFNFFKPVQEIKQKYYQSDAIGLFSKYEGFPNTICEAMACGKPVICSDVSDISKIIQNKKNLFNPNCPEEIKVTIMNIMGYSEQKLLAEGDLNKNLAIDFFEEKVIREKYYQLFKKNRS